MKTQSNAQSIRGFKYLKIRYISFYFAFFNVNYQLKVRNARACAVCKLHGVRLFKGTNFSQYPTMFKVS